MAKSLAIDIKVAKNLAHDFICQLTPLSARIQVAGSIRRNKATVNDIDLIAIPKEPISFAQHAAELLESAVIGQKIIRGTYREIPVEIYLADHETWATLLLIRTGSKEHNIRLCKLARSKGMMLKADGSGLFKVDRTGKSSTRIAGDTEQSIFESLGLPYVPPEDRN